MAWWFGAAKHGAAGAMQVRSTWFACSSHTRIGVRSVLIETGVIVEGMRECHRWSLYS